MYLLSYSLYIRMNKITHMHTQLGIHMHIDKYACTYSQMYVCICTVYVCMPTYIHMYTACTHRHTHAYTHIHYTYVHIQSNNKAV